MTTTLASSKGSGDRSFVLPLLFHQQQSQQQPESRGGSTACERPTTSGDVAAAAATAASVVSADANAPFNFNATGGTSGMSLATSTNTTTTASTASTTTASSSSSSSSSANRARLLTVLFLYCASGTALTLANKLAVKRFPYPNLILVLQNGVAVATLAMGSCTVPLTIGRMPRLSWPLVRLWVPLTVTFSLMLASSLLALQEVSAVTLIVIRNLTSLSVAALEFACLGTALPWQSAGALLGILCGAVMYSLHDITFSPIGYSWLLLNLLSTSAYQVWVKRVIASEAGKKIGALGMSYINNLLSLPVLVVIALAAGEVSGVLGIGSGVWSSSSSGGGGGGGRVAGIGGDSGGRSSSSSSSSGFPSFSSSSSSSSFLAAAAAASSSSSSTTTTATYKSPLMSLDGGILTLLLGSGALGICLSVTAFMLNALISATSMMVANNVNKFFVIMLSECFIQRTLDGVSSLGVAVVMLFGWLYGEASKRAGASARAAAKPAKADANDKYNNNSNNGSNSSSRKNKMSTAKKMLSGDLLPKRDPLSNV